MYVVAVFLKRYSLMAMGFAVSPLGRHSAPYLPSLVEVLIALGLLAVGLLLMTLAAKALPLTVPEEHEPAGGVPVSEAAPERVPDAG
jgi:Ni/Fe-hydrogenase subunit HybB-like protein